MSTQIRDLQKELARLNKRIERDSRRRSELRQRLAELTCREELSSLIDEPGAVTIGYGACASLRGKAGTVKKVKLKRAIVAVDGIEWDFPFDLLHADRQAADIEASINRAIGGQS